MIPNSLQKKKNKSHFLYSYMIQYFNGKSKLRELAAATLALPQVHAARKSQFLDPTNQIWRLVFQNYYNNSQILIFFS